MLNASSSKVRKESLKESSLESKVSSQQSTEEMGSEDSDRCEPNSTEGKRWYELLKEKIGFDVNAKKWMEEHPELAYENKSELLIRLACEVCLAKNTEYDPKNENEEQNNKYIRFDTQRIFALFEVANPLIDPSDRKNFVEFICQKGNVQLLEMICKQESKDLKEGCKVERQYKWQGTFTGYSKLIDLLQYVIDNRCSPEIVLCLAEKFYGYAHIFWNGKQYLDSFRFQQMKGRFNYQDSVVKELLKQAIKLGYKDAVLVMLSGDIYHSIRLMKWKIFKEKPEFLAAYNMIKETVADVINSSVESCKDYVLNLLDQGIKGELHKMSKEDLIHQLEYLGKEVRDKAKISKKKLVKTLEELGEKKGEVILRSTIVGALISTLFFKYQDKVMKGEPFTLKVTKGEKSRKGKILDELNEKIKIGNGKSIEDIVLELIRQLHLGNHIKSHWFFREVLVKVVSENLDKLKAVCAAICKEPMQELLRGEEIHENVTHVLQFFGVEVLTNQIVKSEIPSSCASIADQFTEDINVYSKKEAKEDCSSDELAFSGLTRKIIRDLEEKQDLTDEEKKALISKVLSEIKKGINILDDKTAVKIDIKDIFLSFELINSKIEKERKREIVEFICQKGNVQLLEMICKQENSKKMIEIQYKWQGTFTGYSKLIDLLQYVIDNRCSQEIVLCIVKKVYGCAHIFYNGEQYLEPVVVANMKRNFNYQDSDIKDLLKQVIKLGYKDAVSVMLAGDIYHSIRLIKWQRFQEEQEFIEAYDMIKETVADLISSWVENEESCKDSLLNLLDQGIKIEMKKMSRKDLVYQLEYLGEEVEKETARRKERLVQELKKLGKEKGEVRLGSIIVGALISTLFFRYQDKAIKGRPFTLNNTLVDNNRKEKICGELKISNGKSIDSTMLELVKLLHLGNHIANNWFFREVLAKVVNENLDKLKAVCAAICKEPMQELLKGEEIHENVIDVLQFFGVDTHSLKRDLGSVESQETFEYTDSSSTTETNKLSSQDIVDIAKYYYKWMEPINGEYLEGTNKKVFFTCTDLSSLEDKLKHYKKIQQKDLIFTSIINTGKEHWVTLVIARNVQGKDVAYYCDSFGKKEIPSVLKKALKIDADCIGISQIKQQENEYNCGIFALANAYKITGMIKDKSFTEINVELKGKFDIGQLRKDFAKKVKEMQQKSGVDSEEEVHEPMEVEDGVDSLSNRQLPAETSHDLPELSIAGPSRVKVKVLSSVLPDLKAAERKNEEIVKNNCRQDKSIQYNRGVVSVIASRVGVFHERKVMGGGNSGKRKRNWSEVEDKAIRRKKGGTKAIKFAPPAYLEFLTMFEDEYKNLLLEYEFSYDNLKLLCAPSNIVGCDEFSSPSSDECASPSKDEESEETAFEMYDRAITLLTNGNKKEAISKLNDLSEKHEMPHARYALAVIKFKDLWKGEATKFGKDEKSDLVVSEIIKSLNKMSLENDLRPLNTSLLLKVQKYDIGGYGNQVREITGLTVDDLLYKIVSCTKDTVFKFHRELVPEGSLLQPGQLISKDTDRRDYAECLIRFSMYEFLKLKMLKKDDLRGEDVAIIDAFSQISKCKFIKTFNSFPAWVMYGHAIYLLDSNIGGDNGKRNAVELLNRACRLKHQGALYLRGVLLCDRKNFQFISEDPIRFQECFNGLESFAKRYQNETAACMVANEHLRSDSLVRQMSQGDAEKKAKEILENSGCIYIWKDWKEKQEFNSQLLNSTRVGSGALKKSRLSLSFTTSTASQAHSSSSPLSFTSFQQVEHSPMSPMSYFSSSFVQGLFLGSGERSESVSRFGQLTNEDMKHRGNISHKFISAFDDQYLNSRSILLSRKEYFFLTRRGDRILDNNFSHIEEYYKKGEYNRVISYCEDLIGLKVEGAGHITSDVLLKAYYNKGEALFAQGKYEDAIQVLEKAIGLRSNLKMKDYQEISFARLVAEICCKVGKYNNAISILKEVSGNSDKNLNALIDKDIKEIKNIQSSPDVTENIFLPTRPSTSMSGIESEKHMVEGKKK